MKNSIFLFAVLTIFLVFSCKKDSLLENPKNLSEHSTVGTDPSLAEVTEREGLNDYALTTTGVTYTNGVLVFSSHQVFDNVRASLTELEASESFRTAFLATKGASALDPESADYVQNPGYQAFEERFSGYVSQRRNVQNSERIYLANGGDPDKFDEGFIHSPFAQTVSNIAHEVKIADIIYKEIDTHTTFLVLSGSFTTLDYLRTLANPWEPNLPFDVLRLDDRIEQDEEIIASFMPVACHGNIAAHIVGVNSFRLECFLFDNFNNIEFTDVAWEIKNNNGQVIYTGTGNSIGNPVFTGTLSNAVYPLTVKATTVSTSDCGPLTFTKPIANGTPSCNFSVAFYEDPTDAGDFTFYISGQPACCGITYAWSLDGGPVTTLGPNGQFNFDVGDAEEDFTVTVVMTNPAGCTASQTISVSIDCGSEGDKSTSFPYTTNRRVKLRIWADNSIWGKEFGTKLYHHRKKSNGSWTPENADELKFVFAAGSRFTRDCQEYVNLSTAPYQNSNKKDVMCKYEYGGFSKTVRIPTPLGGVTATGSVKEDGVDFPNIITLTF